MADNFKHSYKQIAKDILSLTVYNVGYQKCTPLYKWGSGVRDHYLIHHIIEGKGYYQVGGKIYTLTKGDTFIVFPYTEVSYWADSENPWEYYWVGFSGSDAKLLLKKTDFSESNPVISTDFGKKLKNAIFNIYNSKGNSYNKSAMMTGYLYIALSLLIEKSDRIIRNTDERYIKQAVDYISYNYVNDISVEDIAEFVGISRSQLFRAFRSNVGKSPSAFLTDFRIRQACSLLADSSLSVSSVAYSVGYSDNLYFSKVFHKIKGVTPSEYRKKKRI